MALRDEIKRGLLLQEIDLTIRKHVEERDQKPHALADARRAMERIEKEIEEMRGLIKSMKADVHGAETTLKDYDDKVGKMTIQSNTVKKNDEYQAIMREIAAMKAEKSLSEDKILEFYGRIEEADAAVKTMEKELQTAKEELDRRKKEVDAAVAEIDRMIAGEKPKRDAIVPEMDKNFLAMYNRIASAKGDGIVFAEAEDASEGEVKRNSARASYMCKACMVELSPQDMHLLKLCKDPLFCRNCSRVLYLNG